MPRSARSPRAAVRPLTVDERLNLLYPSQLAGAGFDRERYEATRPSLPDSHPGHWAFGNADARRAFARSCPDRRLGYILTGSREPVDPAVLAGARA